MANVELTPDAARQKDQLPRVIRVRIIKLIERLKDWPHVSGAKPLSGELAGHWRMRTGDYRLQFHVEGGAVVIEKVGHRDGFYED